ncbi:MAG: TrmH family RNA methyltransferase [Thermomicrobiales bacterium]
MERALSGDDPIIIRSPENPTVKFIHSLRLRKKREAERVFLVEGQLLVDDALSLGVQPRYVILREDQTVLIEELNRRAISELAIKVFDQRLFDSLAETVTPQGVMAVVPIPMPKIPKVELPLVVVADQIRDPGNLGTLLRVSVGAGADAVVLREGVVDPYNPKVVRAALGAHFRIPILGLNASTRAWVIAQCRTRVLADAGGDVDYDRVDWSTPAALLLGPETSGFSKEILELATVRSRIPVQNSLESLNVAVAGAVMLFEASRQRRRSNQGSRHR